jgi:hypothetical protein
MLWRVDIDDKVRDEIVIRREDNIPVAYMVYTAEVNLIYFNLLSRREALTAANEIVSRHNLSETEGE